MDAIGKRRLGELLLEAGVIDATQLQSALGHQRQWGVRLGQALVDLKLAAEGDIVQALSRKYGYDVARLDALDAYALEQALRLVPREFALRNNVFPVAADPGTLTVAMSDPTNLAVVDELRFRTGRRVKVCIGGDREIAAAVKDRYPHDHAIEAIALDLDADEPPGEAVLDPFGGGSKDALEAFFGSGASAPARPAAARAGPPPGAPPGAAPAPSGPRPPGPAVAAPPRPAPGAAPGGVAGPPVQPRPALAQPPGAAPRAPAGPTRPVARPGGLPPPGVLPPPGTRPPPAAPARPAPPAAAVAPGRPGAAPGGPQRPPAPAAPFPHALELEDHPDPAAVERARAALLGAIPQEGLGAPTPAPIPRPSPFTDREQAILRSLERLAAGAPAEPEIVKPAQAMAALFRAMVKRGLLTERDLLDELGRR